MKHYELSSDIRRQMAANEPAVKAAIAIIANNKLTGKFASAADVSGVLVSGGGVVVNNREIKIGGYYVVDDWRDDRGAGGAPSTEEIATFEAIHEVAEMVRNGGIKSLSHYGECRIGDALSSLTKG